MSISITPDSETSILRIQIVGFASRRDIAIATERAVETGEQLRHRAVLIDARLAEVRAEDAAWAETIEDVLAASRPDAPIAYLPPPEWPESRAGIARESAATIGITFEIFSYPDPALDWLNRHMPPPPETG